MVACTEETKMPYGRRCLVGEPGYGWAFMLFHRFTSKGEALVEKPSEYARRRGARADGLYSGTISPVRTHHFNFRIIDDGEMPRCLTPVANDILWDLKCTAKTSDECECFHFDAAALDREERQHREEYRTRVDETHAMPWWKRLVRSEG